MDMNTNDIHHHNKGHWDFSKVQGQDEGKSHAHMNILFTPPPCKEVYLKSRSSLLAVRQWWCLQKKEQATQPK
eukprot:586227-Amphidinium_carterae.1